MVQYWASMANTFLDYLYIFNNYVRIVGLTNFCYLNIYNNIPSRCFYTFWDKIAHDFVRSFHTRCCSVFKETWHDFHETVTHQMTVEFLNFYRSHYDLQQWSRVHTITEAVKGPEIQIMKLGINTTIDLI